MDILDNGMKTPRSCMASKMIADDQLICCDGCKLIGLDDEVNIYNFLDGLQWMNYYIKQGMLEYVKILNVDNNKVYVCGGKNITVAKK